MAEPDSVNEKNPLEKFFSGQLVEFSSSMIVHGDEIYYKFKDDGTVEIKAKEKSKSFSTFPYEVKTASNGLTFLIIGEKRYLASVINAELVMSSEENRTNTIFSTKEKYLEFPEYSSVYSK